MQITRKEYQYDFTCQFKDFLMYKCRDRDSTGCKGNWKIPVEVSTKGVVHNAIGALNRPHTVDYNSHSHSEVYKLG